MRLFEEIHGKLAWFLYALAVGGVLSFPSCRTSDSDTGMEGAPPPLIPAKKKPEEVSPPLPDNSIQVGDGLELFVKEDSSFDRVYHVRERGDIIIPRIGRIPVAGLSVSAASAKIESALEATQLTEATIILDRVKRAPVERSPNVVPNDPAQEGRKIRVYMTEKVNRPGLHILTLPENRPLGVYEAILISGGISRYGNEQKIYVLRTDAEGRKHRIPINVRDIERGKAEDPPIGHGDIVVVPEKVFGT